jgi:hypothetical protein
VTELSDDVKTEPPLLRGWLIFVALFIVLQLVLPVLLFLLRMVGFLGDPGYIEAFQQAADGQRTELAIQFAFDVLSLALPFVFWVVLCKKFFTRTSGFAVSFLKTLLLSWSLAFAIEALRAFTFGVAPDIRGIGGLVFGLGLAQWLMHSPRVKAVFIR